MTDQWADPEQLRADGRRVLHWIQRQGVVTCCDPTERERAREYLLPVFRALEDIIRPVALVAVYLYRQTDQPPSLRTTSGTPIQDVDGIEWKDVTEDRGELHAIGLSCEALKRGSEYTQFLFLHELAHVFGSEDHSPEFHHQLDHLIEKFNRSTGATVT